MSVFLSVTNFQLLLLFCFSMESSHFWPSVLHDPLYKALFFDYWLTPPNAQNLLPKICTKSPISRLVCQIDWRCLGLHGGFWGWPIQWNHAKFCGADPSTKFGLDAEIQSPTGLYLWLFVSGCSIRIHTRQTSGTNVLQYSSTCICTFLVYASMLFSPYFWYIILIHCGNYIWNKNYPLHS